MLNLLFVECLLLFAAAAWTYLTSQKYIYIKFPVSLSLLLRTRQSKICTWLSTDWGGCTCPSSINTSWCAAWRWKIFTTHARRSWTNYFPFTTTVRNARMRLLNLPYKLYCTPSGSSRQMKNHFNFLIFFSLNFDFPYHLISFHDIPVYSSSISIQ